MKTVLFLGGARHQIPPIIYAREKGYRTICCDYTPDSPCFKLSDVGYIASTTDLKAILDISSKEKIDGIVAYASDPAAPTAAYVAEKLGLPGNPYDSVKILTQKHLYRDFLHQNGFHSPRTYRNGDFVNLPCVMKPVDSSGSKGVLILHDLSTFPESIKYCSSFSRSGFVIVEDYIKREGYQIAGDGFVIDGKLVFCGFAQEHFDPDDGIVPVGESFPYCGETSRIKDEVQRLINLLHIKNGALNFDIVLKDDDVYLMEIGPRNGGCLIPEVIKYQCGVDMIAATVEAALGHKIFLGEPKHKGFFSSYMIHSKHGGKFKELIIDQSINIREAFLWVNKGDDIPPYRNSSCTIGNMILEWENHKEMVSKMDDILEYVKVVIE